MMDYEREILFGVLARQVGFVSREELRSAVREWPIARHPSLGDWLVEKGGLSEEQQSLVQQLAEQHLKDGSSAAHCLTQFEDVEALRNDLEQLVGRPRGLTMAGGDATLPVARRAEDGPPQKSLIAGTPSPELRFTLLRPHAHGGLGEVYVAHDAELNREVALKRIRNVRLDTPENRARFILEAEVTGGLEHPGIVPVYSLGTSDDGRPFYAMRFIKGESLKQAIGRYHQSGGAGRESQRLLELRKLLTRFIDVCNAIEYAHSRGVLHRDLKPDNIMLGAYGETLVVDWGLAKPIGAQEQAVTLGPASGAELPEDDGTGSKFSRASGTAPTQMGAAIGTPAYMSPEQASGELDRIGVASDVYSLGATLYCILTGQPPFLYDNVAQVLERVRRGDLTPPRSVNAHVPPALEAICVKAMAHDPADRYPTPRVLAEELERWLADEPVEAHEAQWHERLARWARRHRRSVEAAAAALALITIVSVMAAVVVHSAKQQAEHERDATRAALEAETAAKREARTALAAEREARLEARRALDNYVSMVTEEESLDGDQVQSLRKRLLSDALAYYEKLLDENSEEAKVRHDLASAILRVGRIHHASGSREEAIDAFEQALDAFSELAGSHPQEAQYQRDLALCHRSLGDLKSQASDLPGAAGNFLESLMIWQHLAQENSSPEDRRELADAWYDVGQAQAGLAQWARAANAYEQSLAILKQLLRAAPNDENLQSALRRSQNAAVSARQKEAG